MRDPLSTSEVALYHDPFAQAYGELVPYDPQLRYPEYDGPLSTQGTANAAYDAVRETLHLLKLDPDRFGRADWNPLGELISPGETVAIKPNLVLDRHLKGGRLDAVITHGSVIRAVVDYVCLALHGQGRIVMGDAPLQMADFDMIRQRTGLDEIAENARGRWGVAVEVVDFRRVRAIVERGHVLRTEEQKGDPRGYRVVDLARNSLFRDVSGGDGSLRVTCYDSEQLSQHHNGQKHEYLIAGSILEADCVISISKLKTHRKAGITGALKNVVGINGHKDWLPHHRAGARAECGDEYLHPSVIKRTSAQLAERALRAAPGMRSAWEHLSIAAGAAAKRVSRDPYTEGSWYGNDTLWRTVLDLNRALLYADRNGKTQSSRQRRCLHLVDAIVAGDGEGPLEPDCKVCGMMLGGFSPVAVDTVAAGMMGFDYRRIPSILQSYLVEKHPFAQFLPGQISVQSNHPEFGGIDPLAPAVHFNFRPAAGWRGHIEREEVETLVTQP